MFDRNPFTSVCPRSVTSVKTRDELYGGGPALRRSSHQSAGSGSGESPRSSKLVPQQSIVGGGSSRVTRQRSFKNASEDVIKRSRAQQATSYQLSQDLHDKQLGVMYGFSVCRVSVCVCVCVCVG